MCEVCEERLPAIAAFHCIIHVRHLACTKISFINKLFLSDNGASFLLGFSSKLN